MTAKDNNDTSHYEGALLEDVNDKLDALLEWQQPLTQISRDITELKDDMREVKQDISVMKAVLTSQSGQLHNHERRITTLEKRAV
ncbi:MAG: hypothetical protein ACR2FM_02335 [Candidatus Saccharimonadales bacterium]